MKNNFIGKLGIALMLLIFSINSSAQRSTSQSNGSDGRNLSIGIGLLGGIILGAFAKPLTPESPPVKLWIALQSMNSWRSEYDENVRSAKKTGTQYYESLQQWACKKGLSGESQMPLNKYTFETISKTPEAMRAPENMTLEQCVVLLGGRIEDIDTPAKAQAREEKRLLSLAEAKAAAEAAERAQAEAKEKADQEAKIAAEEAARKYEEERPAREAAQRKAEAEQKALSVRMEKEAKEREAAKKLAEAKRVSDIVSNKTDPKNSKEIDSVFQTLNGYDVAIMPKIKPDGKLYRFHGIIDMADESSFIAQAYQVIFMDAEKDRYVKDSFDNWLPQTSRTYVSVVMDSPNAKQRYLQDGRRNQRVTVVGYYKSNAEVKLINGRIETVARFHATHFYPN